MTDIFINPSHFFMKLIFLHKHLKDGLAKMEKRGNECGDNDQS